MAEAMSRRITPPEAGAPSESPATTTIGTRALLACGVVAGPLVVTLSGCFVQVHDPDLALGLLPPGTRRHLSDE